MSLIETTDLWKTYIMGSEEIHALRGVSIQIERGEYVAIMGPSGSGKSTLVNTLTGMMPIDGGAVVVSGKELKKIIVVPKRIVNVVV